MLRCLLSLSLVISSCMGSSSQAKDDCKDYFEMPSTKRLEEFPTYTLEKQLLIHRCGLDRYPLSDRSYEIAARGETIIPTLLEILRNESKKSGYESEKTKYGVILIFQRLASDGNVKDRRVLVAVEQALREIQTEWIRDEAKKSVTDISEQYRKN